MNIVKRFTAYGFSLKMHEGSFFDDKLMEDRGVYSQAESDLVKSLVRSGDLTIDVGCHVGWFTCLMGLQGARVFGLEPNPEMYAIADENVQDLKLRETVELLCAAASDVDGEAELFLPSEWNDGWGSLAAPDPDSQRGTITVKTFRLDGVMPKGQIRLLKVDVEGVELQVLYGLGARISDVEHVLIECADRPERLIASSSSAAAVSNFLVAAGFVAHEFTGERWVAVPGAWSRMDHDFLFVNQRKGR